MPTDLLKLVVQRHMTVKIDFLRIRLNMKNVPPTLGFRKID